MRFRSILRVALFISGCLRAAYPCRAAEVPATGDAVVTLPAFVVNEDREQPRWRYIGHRDFELLTLAPNGVANKFANDLAVCIEIMDALIPPAARLRLNTPARFILDLQQGVRVGGGGVAALAPNRVYNSVTQGTQSLYLGGLDRDAYALYLSIDGSGDKIASNSQSYAKGSIWGRLYPSLLTQAQPAPAAWLAIAVNRALAQLGVRDRSAVLHTSLVYPPPVLMSFVGMARLLNRFEPNQPIPTREIQAVRAQDTAALFVQWALFADEGKYRARFWDFYRRSALAPDEDETLFQSAFGLTAAEIRWQVSAYRDYLREDLRRIAFPKSRQTVSPARIRDATPAEIARITGEWAGLAAREIPTQKDRLLTAAGRIFDRGLRDSPKRDPKLLAAAGIFQAETGHDAEARPLLEEATKAGVARPQAYLELARIRLAAAQAAPAASGKLSAPQIASVMEPLRQAFAQSDQQENYYELLLSLWENAADKPTPAELAPLAACAPLFTRRTDLTLRSAQLHAAFGYAAEARTLSENALPFAKDKTVRAALMALSQSGPSTNE